MKTTSAEDDSYQLSLQLWRWVVPIIGITSLLEWALYLIYQNFFHSWSPILAQQPEQEAEQATPAVAQQPEQEAEQASPAVAEQPERETEQASPAVLEQPAR